MGYLFLMTLAGSALFIGYLCWKRVLGKFMTQCMKYRVLMIVMLVFVVPWRWIKGIYKWIIELFWPKEVTINVKGLVDVANIETNEIVYRTKEYQLLMLIMLVWFVIAA